MHELKTGTKTIGTSADRLLPAGHKAYSHVLVEAAPGNTNDVFVGHDANVSASNGWRLDAGQSVKIPIDDPSKIWVIGGASNQTIKWLLV